jgi:hypothetical protein
LGQLIRDFQTRRGDEHNAELTGLPHFKRLLTVRRTSSG